MGVVVAVGWVLAGCTRGGDPGPSLSVEEPVTASPSETPEPTPTETGPVKPERPAAMERDDAEGAAAAAEYFLELYPYVMATGDTAEWDAMTWAEKCGFCTSVGAQAAEISAGGHEFVGGQVTASLAKIWPLDTLVNAYPIDLDASMQSAQIIDASGEPIEDIEGFEGVMELSLLHDGNGWRVLAVSVQGA